MLSHNGKSIVIFIKDRGKQELIALFTPSLQKDGREANIYISQVVLAFPSLLHVICNRRHYRRRAETTHGRLVLFL
jgi:hypothetical protein